MKTFILDTNVLIHDSNSLFAFGDNEVVLPIYVVEEVDHFKKDLGARGRNAREVARALDRLGEKGDLSQGVKTETGGVICIRFSKRGLPQEFITDNSPDNNILSTALMVLEENKLKGIETFFVTKDVNLRVRAHVMGLAVMDYDTERRDVSELYSGVSEVDIEAENIAKFYQNGSIEAPKGSDLSPNEFVVMHSMENSDNTALGRHNNGYINAVRKLKNSVWGIRPRNKEQQFAMDLLLDDSVPLVTLVGKAGTGKTLIAVAAGLQMVAEERRYSRLLISRPVIPMGRDIGYLPGDMGEKLGPWMQPIYDNVEFLASIDRSGDDSKGGRSGGDKKASYIDYLFDEGILEIEPLTYIRGRSIPKQYMIIDEAQNLTPHEVKTILTRAGENTKIVFTGDPYQIDNPYIDTNNNGLVHLVNRFRGQTVAGHVTLVKGERSGLAELAATLL